LSDAIYAAPPASGWTNPVSAPAVPIYRRVVETPYWDLVRELTAADFDYVDDLSGYVQAAAAKPSDDSISCALWTKYSAEPDSAYEEQDIGSFCPSGTLVSALSPAESSTVTLSNVKDLADVVTGTYAIIGSEYVRVDSVNTGTNTVTIARGVLDTVPQTHSAGASILFADGYQMVDETEHVSGDVVNAKLLPSTGLGTLAISTAPADSVTLNRRHSRPYPPGLFRINSALYPTQVIAASIPVSWAHRDRLTQTATLIAQSSGSIGPEAGTTYSINLRRADTNAILTSTTGLSGTSTTISTSYEGAVILELWSVVGGVASSQMQRHQFDYYKPLAAPTNLSYTYQA